MFRQILFTQWRWGAPVVVLLATLSIALPLAALSGLPAAPGAIMDRVSFWGYLYPSLAVLTGLLIGMSAWASDHRGNHVYALTLPVPRWKYALLRYGAGVVLTLAVAVAVLVGALIATSRLTLPAGLHSNVGAVGVQFVLAALLVFSMVFAVASGTNRTAGWILAGLGGLMFAEFLANSFSAGTKILEPLWSFAVSASGPFAVFSHAWLLVTI